MKLESPVDKIKNFVSKIEKITSRNISLPILSSILIIAKDNILKLRATNLDIGIEVNIPAKIEKEGVIAVEGSVLNNFLLNIQNGEKINLEIVGNNLNISSKYNKTIIKTLPYEDFPTIPILKEENYINIPVDKFINGLKSVFYSASVSDIKPEISSVYIYSNEDNLIFVATDSFRLAERKLKIKNINLNGVLIPFKNTSEIIRIFDGLEGDLKIVFNKNQISFEIDNIYLTSRLIDGVFPDYNQIIPEQNTTKVIVLKQDLINSLKLTNIFSDKFNQINFKIKPNNRLFKISSSNTDVGENTTEIEASLFGEDVEINFNYRYINDCFQSIKEDSLVLEFSGSNKPMVIKGSGDNSFTYLVMPMNN